MNGINEDANHGFSHSLRDCVIDNIRIDTQIGRGANGRILEAKWEGIVVAVKEIHSILMDGVSDLEFESFKRSFVRECEQSSRLRHPNIVRFFGIYHPPGARVPSLVMERLHCSLTSLLASNLVVPIGTKMSIIKDVALGLRYLHTRNPPIIHRDLSSNNVLLSKGMEGKIGDLGTTRLVDPTRQSRMTKAPGTVNFMPPEALEDVTNIRYGKELDVFSFGCVMLHTLSHEWPTPSQAVIIDPETGVAIGGRTEVERRSKYFERIDRSRSDLLIPLIESCLNNLPKNRPSIVTVCDQLEGQQVDREHTSSEADELAAVSALQQVIQQKEAEIQRKNTEIQLKNATLQMKNTELRRKDTEIQQKGTELQRKDSEVQWKDAEIQSKDGEIQRKDGELQVKDDELQIKDFEIQMKTSEIQYLTTALQEKDVMLDKLRSDLNKLQTTTDSAPKMVNKSSSDFWSSLKLTWQPCADLPHKCLSISIAELNGKVYAAMVGSGGAYRSPYMYDSSKDQWSTLPPLPYAHFSLVTVPDRKQLLAIGGNVNINGEIEISNKVFLWDKGNRKWTTSYPNMPTARFNCSSISHGSTVIVAGGITCYNPRTVTRAVEVLHIKEHSLFTKSHWSVVEQLPHVVYGAIPLIVDDKLYIAVGGETHGNGNTCNIVTASLPELLQSSNKNTSGGQVWYKLPDMPYPSLSINHYQGRLITFSGRHEVEQPDKGIPVFKSVPLIHIYNPNTKTWDCIGEMPYKYLLWRSVHITNNKIFFTGGVTDTFAFEKEEILTTCSTLTFSSCK